MAMLQSRVVRPMPCSAASAPSRVLRLQQRRSLRVRAAVSDMEEIDPFTGAPILKSAATAPIASCSVQAGSYKWGYRQSSVDAAKSNPANVPVLLLHGIGSNSYCYRKTLGLLGSDGFEAIAPDWIGHGSSDKPTSGFDFSEASYIKELSNFVKASGMKQPFALVVHGYILGQYAMLYALENADKVDRIMILNTPVSLKTKLRPDLSAYKAPLAFMRPGNKPFAGDMFNASGSPYAMEGKDAKVYAEPYLTSPEASAVIAKTMDKVDFDKLLRKVNEGYMTWRKPSVLLFGGSDSFMDQNAPFDFLDSKRTNMKAVAPSAQLGHMPQEDYAEAIHEQMMTFLTGGTDNFVAAPRIMKMTKKGAVEA